MSRGGNVYGLEWDIMCSCNVAATQWLIPFIHLLLSLVTLIVTSLLLSIGILTTSNCTVIINSMVNPTHIREVNSTQ